MRKLISLIALAAFLAALVPASASAAERYHHRYPRRYEPVREAAVIPPPNPLGFVLAGAGIGAIIGAVVCPPCGIAGSALTSGGGALLGGGIGAVSGGLVAAAATPHDYYARYHQY